MIGLLLEHRNTGLSINAAQQTLSSSHPEIKSSQVGIIVISSIYTVNSEPRQRFAKDHGATWNRKHGADRTTFSEHTLQHKTTQSITSIQTLHSCTLNSESHLLYSKPKNSSGNINRGNNVRVTFITHTKTQFVKADNICFKQCHTDILMSFLIIMRPSRPVAKINSVIWYHTYGTRWDDLGAMYPQFNGKLMLTEMCFQLKTYICKFLLSFTIELLSQLPM